MSNIAFWAFSAGWNLSLAIDRLSDGKYGWAAVYALIGIFCCAMCLIRQGGAA